MNLPHDSSVLLWNRLLKVTLGHPWIKNKGKWPLTHFEHFAPMYKDLHREACLQDCLCAVAIFRDRDCWKKLLLSNGRMDVNVEEKALTKVSKFSFKSLLTLPWSSRREKVWTLVLTTSVLLGSSGILDLSHQQFYWVFTSLSTEKVRKEVCTYSSLIGTNLQSFTYQWASRNHKWVQGRTRCSCSTVYDRSIPSDQIPLTISRARGKTAKECSQGNSGDMLMSWSWTLKIKLRRTNL